jgi:hypothetical protein
MWVVPVGLFLILVAVFSIGMWSGPPSNKSRRDHDSYFRRMGDTVTNSLKANSAAIEQAAALGTAPNTFTGEANRNAPKGLDRGQ